MQNEWTSFLAHTKRVCEYQNISWITSFTRQNCETKFLCWSVSVSRFARWRTKKKTNWEFVVRRQQEYHWRPSGLDVALRSQKTRRLGSEVAGIVIDEGGKEQSCSKPDAIQHNWATVLACLRRGYCRRPLSTCVNYTHSQTSKQSRHKMRVRPKYLSGFVRKRGCFRIWVVFFPSPNPPRPICDTHSQQNECRREWITHRGM